MQTYTYFCKKCNDDEEFIVEWIKTFTQEKKLQIGAKCTVCEKRQIFTQFF